MLKKPPLFPLAKAKPKEKVFGGCRELARVVTSRIVFEYLPAEALALS